ncbi:hypothetical protein [Metabacillus iocasae]|uniref:Beta-galactosidase beta subunit n=1 Tax=Priestia iocasae TaxID=2291674 RepID=A0ABS2QVZ5_9BACI|nr:hypothetical protein [Metabacillus iocasae]MBM7703641.1 beta-galactosidase beta subunit [Metabacillus iocasae]
MDFFILFLVCSFSIILFIYFLSNNRKSSAVQLEGCLAKTYGYIQSAEGIDPQAISILELYENKVMINRVAMIPFERIHRATFSKVVTKETSHLGSSVHRYYGELTILFTDKNGQEVSVRCETPKKNQFNHIYQYELIKKKINKRLGLEDQQLSTKLPEPYEL